MTDDVPVFDPVEEAATAAARRLLGLLERIPSRAVRALNLRLVEGRSREECAGFFGISPEAFDVMLLRAVDAFLAEAVPSPAPRPPAPPFSEELSAARELAAALASGCPPAGAAQARRFSGLTRLRALAPQLLAEMEAASRLEESSRSRWDGLLRKGLVLLLAGAAIYLYAR